MPPEPDENQPHHSVFVSCFHWILMALWRCIKAVLFLLVFIVLYPIGVLVAVMLLLCIVFILWFIGTVSSVTFPFLLASWLVLRFSQFVKRAQDYDKVTQVKMFVEWYMFINCALLVFAIAEFGTNSVINMKIVGKPMSQWGEIIFYKILRLFGIRFILFWIIFKYMPRMTLEHNESGLKVVQTTCDIVDCLLFLYSGFVLITSIPQHEFLGLPILIWFAVPIFVVIGWNIITLSTHLIVWSIHQLISWYLNHVHDNNERSHRYLLLERLLSVHFLVYYGNGLKRSFNFMLSSLLLLLVWVLYFAAHLTKTEGSKAKTVRDFGTWTCTVLLILSFLWILKDFVLLLWEANAVYSRLSAKIVEARRSLYFLGIIGRRSHDILKLRYSEVSRIDEKNGAQIFVAKNLAGVDVYYQDKNDEEDNDDMGPREGINDDMGPREGITEENDKNDEEDNNDMGPREGITEENSSQDMCKLSHKKRARVRRDLLLPKEDTMTLFNIQQVAQYFLNAADALYEVKTSNIARNLNATPNIARNLNPQGDHRDILKKLIDGKNGKILEKPVYKKNNASDGAESSPKPEVEDSEEWCDFERLLKLDSSTCVSPSIVKTWLEKSHNNCLFLANTLRSAKEVVDCLNNIISILLICASIILWLLFTGINTDGLLLVASPLLAATFVFGDTCKTLFQGIIFVYVVHPFDVGDLCIVDGRMMEVKSVGVWKTMFSHIEKIGTREEVIYPNSELAMKTIINHKTEFYWNDSVEFDVEHLDKQRIKELKTQIESLLADGKDASKCDPHQVAVLSSSDDAKIIVRFKHPKCQDCMTNFEYVKTKNALRSAIILNVQELLNNMED
ncbi:uncharacterized protein LOC141652962 isoform X2 [Silene latifolia]